MKSSTKKICQERFENTLAFMLISYTCSSHHRKRWPVFARQLTMPSQWWSLDAILPIWLKAESSAHGSTLWTLRLDCLRYLVQNKAPHYEMLWITMDDLSIELLTSDYDVRQKSDKGHFCQLATCSTIGWRFATLKKVSSAVGQIIDLQQDSSTANCLSMAS